MGTLDTRVAIVTGGARGIGRAYCLGLAREGAAVVVADLVGGDDVVAEIAAQGGRAISVIVDVSDRDSTEALARRAGEEFGRVDILVNNAAYYRDVRLGPFTDIPLDEWDKAFAVNVRGPWLCTRAVYPYMRAQHDGRVINVSSMTAFKRYVLDEGQGFMHYVASKSAVVGLTRAMAIEMGPDNIAVNTVVPEYIPHQLGWSESIDEGVTAQRIFKRTQVPEDMVGLVVFLAGPGSGFITGQSFLVNGGTHFQ